MLYLRGLVELKRTKYSLKGTVHSDAPSAPNHDGHQIHGALQRLQRLLTDRHDDAAYIELAKQAQCIMVRNKVE